MSSREGDRGGLSQAAPTNNTQDEFDNSTQTAATCSTAKTSKAELSLPEAQVRLQMGFHIMMQMVLF